MSHNYRNSKWTDNSGFEYDLPPINVAVKGIGGEVFTGAPTIYELGKVLFELTEDKYNSWTNWINKIQPDYRFATTSDKNAETYMFPNVDDPWMFTEYIYHGKDTDKIIEPPIYNPETLEVVNNVREKRISKYGWQSDEMLSDISNLTDDEFVAKYGHTKKQTPNNYPTGADGVRVYDQKVNVQCVKWGEHGNIPPKVINTTAPKSWIEPDGIGNRITPVIVMRMGSPVFAKTFGVITTDSNGNQSIQQGVIYTLTKSNVGEPDAEWSYSASGSPTPQPKPNIVRIDASRGLGQGLVHFVGTDFENGEVVHEGCQFWDTSGGIASCSLSTQLSSEQLSGLYPDPSKCTTDENANCSFYKQRELPIEIGTWEASASTPGEWTRMYMGDEGYGKSDTDLDSATATMDTVNAPVMGVNGMMGGGQSLAMVQSEIMRNSTPRMPREHDIRWSIKYEVTTVPAEERKLIGLTPGQSESQVQIERGTGKMALDTYENKAYGGTDPIFFGDANQISYHRWMTNVMHCQNTKYCNNIYGEGMQDGWEYDKVAGGDGQCRYYVDATKHKYGGGCPFNSIPKRAYEYQQRYKKAVDAFFPLVKNYIPTNGGSSSASASDIWYEAYHDHYVLLSREDKTDIYKGPNCSQKLGDNYILVHFTIKLKDNEYELDELFAYIDVYNHGGSALDNSPWLVKLYDDFDITENFTICVENEGKFLGGCAPEYKDLSKRGNEFLQEVGVSDGFIGDSGVAEKKSWTDREGGYMVGYWIDKYGEWILDGRTLGDAIGQEIPEDARKSCTPKIIKGATPITGIPGVTIIDPIQDISKQPTIQRANVYSTDTDALLQSEEIQNLENDDDPPKKCPPTYNAEGLPSARNGWYDIDNNLTIHEKFFNSNEYEQDPENPENPENPKPTAISPWGGRLRYQRLRQFPICHALGSVTVWGMPGMVVRGNAYFWKNPTFINNALLRQMKFKLGNKNEKGGGWTLRDGSDGLSEKSVPKYTSGKAYYQPFDREILPSGIMRDEEIKKDEENYGWDGITDTDYEKFFSYNEFAESDPQKGLDGFDDENFDGSKINEQFITPYSDDDGLKMVTMKQLINLRNIIQPTLGYVIGKNLHSPDFESLKAKYNDRTTAKTEKDWNKHQGRLPPQILAAVSGNVKIINGFIQMWNGKIPSGSVRIYTPPGLEWWRLNNVIGGISRANGISTSHMDNVEREPLSMAGYHGDRLVSSAMFFPHGYIPLNKEIIKAYALIEPSDFEVTFESIGSAWYNQTNFFWHWHPWTTPHEDAGRHDSDEFGGINAHGDTIDIQPHTSQEGDLYPKYHRIMPEIQVQGENQECDPVWFTNIEMPNFDEQMSRLSHYDDSGNHGRSNPWNYISWDGYGEHIKQNLTEDELWKHYTFDEFDDLLKKYTADVELEVETYDYKSSYKIKQMSRGILIDDVIPQQTQPISGYFDLKGMNSMRACPKKIKIAERSYDSSWQHDGQFIVQSASGGKIEPKAVGFKMMGTRSSSSGTNTNYKPANGQNNAGEEMRVLDITGAFKKVYEDRIEREYTVHTGVSLEDKLKQSIPISKWEGSGGEDAENKKDRLLWNYRYRLSDEYGYWLNDAWHYPELVKDDVSIPNFGEKIAQPYENAEVTGTETEPFNIESTVNDRLKIKINGGDEIEIIITDPSGSGHSVFSINASELAEQINSSISGAVAENLSGKLTIKTDNAGGGKTIEIMEVSDNAYGEIGLTEGVYGGISDRISEVTEYEEFYHPKNLLYADSHSVGAKPKAKDKWFFKVPYDALQHFTVDLMNVPFEKSRKDWRYQRGKVNCANAICKNPNCRIGSKGFTVTEWNEYVHSGTVFGPVPSFSSEYCCSCGYHFTEADGLIKTSGDGIDTYFYENIFEKNAFIRKIIVDPVGDDTVLNAYKHGFSVQIKNFNTDVWETIVDVQYDRITSKYYWRYDGVDYESTEPPTEFDLTDKMLRARYVRYIANPEATEISYNGSTGEKNDDASYNLNSDIEYIDDYFTNAKLLLGTSENYTKTYTVLSSKGNVVYVNGTIPDGYEYWQIDIKEWRGGCAKFEVYGLNYSSSDMTITAPPLVETFPFSMTNFELTNQPTRIVGVYAGTAMAGMGLEEVETIQEVIWNTQTRTLNGIQYKYIVGGKYYYDYKNMKIVISNVDQDGNNIFTLNSELDKSKFNRKTTPSMITVKYWTGAGTSVVLPFTANGNGPSYQVEKEAICEFVSSELPEIQQSVKLPDIQGNWKRRDISWVVYNIEPAKGNFTSNYLTGTELDQDWSYDKWVKLYGKQGSKINGTVTGDVIIYGEPDTIVSGEMIVRAPETKVRTYRAGDGTVVTTHERTGGLRQLGVLIRAKVSENEDGNRRSLAYKVPTVIVYARERDITEPL